MHNTGSTFLVKTNFIRETFRFSSSSLEESVPSPAIDPIWSLPVSSSFFPRRSPRIFLEPAREFPTKTSRAGKKISGGENVVWTNKLDVDPSTIDRIGFQFSEASRFLFLEIPRERWKYFVSVNLFFEEQRLNRKSFRFFCNPVPKCLISFEEQLASRNPSNEEKQENVAFLCFH